MVDMQEAENLYKEAEEKGWVTDAEKVIEKRMQKRRQKGQTDQNQK